MTAPSIEYGLLSPMLIVFGAAIVGVLVEAFLPRRRRYLTQVALAVAGLAAALATVVTTDVESIRAPFVSNSPTRSYPCFVSLKKARAASR